MGDPGGPRPRGSARGGVDVVPVQVLAGGQGGLFAHLPQLVRQVTLFAPREGSVEGVEGAKLELVSSHVDALGEIPAYEIFSAAYGLFDCTMLPGKVLRRVYNPLAFAPYAMFKNDYFAYIDPNTLPDLTGAERRRQRRELAKY